MKIVVIGGSGLIGSKRVTNLDEHGHEAVAASSDSGVDTLTGAGLGEALAGASMVVDVSNSPSFEDAAVLEFFETSTRNLLAAEAAGRLDGLIRRGLSARNDHRTVVADPHARYFDSELGERTLVPGEGARLGEIRLEDWLRQPVNA
jgi:uncharacterized protein YbjT (DUF2867 family)